MAGATGADARLCCCVLNVMHLWGACYALRQLHPCHALFVANNKGLDFLPSAGDGGDMLSCSSLARVSDRQAVTAENDSNDNDLGCSCIAFDVEMAPSTRVEEGKLCWCSLLSANTAI